MPAPAIEKAPQKLELSECTLELFNPSTHSWKDVRDEVMEIEQLCFGDKGYSEERIGKDFERPDIMAVFLRDRNRLLIGMSYAYAHEEEKTAWVISANVRPEFQHQGIVGVLMSGLEDEMRKQAYTYFRQNCTADGEDSYADAVERHYGDRIVEKKDRVSPEGFGKQRMFKIRL